MPFITTPERFGREEGIKEGIKEGVKEGVSRGISRGIEVALRIKFGKSAAGLMSEIGAIEEIDKLEKILDAIETAASPDDLRRIWAR